MSTDAALSEATVREWTWKPGPTRDMLVAVLRLALRVGVNGEFSALDLPCRGADEQGGTGIAGSVFRLLREAGILARHGRWLDTTFYPTTILNAGGNPIGVYRLANPGLARALLERHSPGETKKQEQKEMAFA